MFQDVLRELVLVLQDKDIPSGDVPKLEFDFFLFIVVIIDVVVVVVGGNGTREGSRNESVVVTRTTGRRLIEANVGVAHSASSDELSAGGVVDGFAGDGHGGAGFTHESRSANNRVGRSADTCSSDAGGAIVCTSLFLGVEGSVKVEDEDVVVTIIVDGSVEGDDAVSFDEAILNADEGNTDLDKGSGLSVERNVGTSGVEPSSEELLNLTAVATIEGDEAANKRILAEISRVEGVLSDKTTPARECIVGAGSASFERDGSAGLERTQEREDVRDGENGVVTLRAEGGTKMSEGNRVSSDIATQDGAIGADQSVDEVELLLGLIRNLLIANGRLLRSRRASANRTVGILTCRTTITSRVVATRMVASAIVIIVAGSSPK